MTIKEIERLTFEEASRKILANVLGEQRHKNREIEALDNFFREKYQRWNLGDKSRLLLTFPLRIYYQENFKLLRATRRIDQELFELYQLEVYKWKQRLYEHTCGKRKFYPSAPQIPPRSLVYDIAHNMNYIKDNPPTPDQIKDLAWVDKGPFVLSYKWFCLQEIGLYVRKYKDQGNPLSMIPAEAICPSLSYFRKQFESVHKNREKYATRQAEWFQSSFECGSLRTILKERSRISADKIFCAYSGLLNQIPNAAMGKLSKLCYKYCLANEFISEVSNPTPISGGRTNNKPQLVMQIRDYVAYRSVKVNEDSVLPKLIKGCDLKEEEQLVQFDELDAISKIDPLTVIICIDPAIPMRQILAEYIPHNLGGELPPVILCNTVDMDDREYEWCERGPNNEYLQNEDGTYRTFPDPNHPRVQLFFKKYIRIPFTYAGKVPPGDENKNATGYSILGDLSLYVAPPKPEGAEKDNHEQKGKDDGSELAIVPCHI